MFISSSEYDVLETPINQTFERCKEGNATLYVMQRDSGFLFLLTLRKKYAEVRCNLTGKKIPKRKWNDQTKATATALLAQHKISKTGWCILYFLLAGLITFMTYVVYSEIESSNRYNATFVSKTDSEKNILLSKLGKGDLIKTTNFVYKIKSISKAHITLVKSSVVNSPNGEYVDPYILIDESKHAFNSESQISINPSAFWKHHMINRKSEYGGELIIQILNK